MHLAVDQVAVVDGLVNFAACDDGVGCLQQFLSGKEVVDGFLCHFVDRELREHAIGERRAVGNGGLVGIDRIADAEAAEQVEMQEGTKGERLAFDDAIVVGGEESRMTVNVAQEVVHVGNAAVGVGPELPDVAGGHGCLVVVGGYVVILCGVVKVPLLT